MNGNIEPFGGDVLHHSAKLQGKGCNLKRKLNLRQALETSGGQLAVDDLVMADAPWDIEPSPLGASTMTSAPMPSP